MIAITVEKGMDWKQVVVPTSTKPSAASAAPSPAQSADAKPPPSEQYVSNL